MSSRMPSLGKLYAFSLVCALAGGHTVNRFLKPEEVFEDYIEQKREELREQAEEEDLIELLAKVQTPPKLSPTTPPNTASSST
ncbi:hypothetical protein QOT17_015301 [Balamuthia mandrillaris]